MSPEPTYRTHEEILEGIRRNESAAFDALIGTYADLVHMFCVSLLGSDESSRRLLPAIFTEAMPEIRAAKTGVAIERDLLRAAARMVFAERGVDADGAPFAEIPIDELMPDGSGGKGGSAHDWSLDPDEEERRPREKELLREILTEIPPQYGMLIVLHDMEEMSVHDLADIVNLSVPNIRIRIHRARLLLRRELTRRLIEDGEGGKG
jgi:RNA polymerase sigma-70 factor (ECF subfamily)